MVSKPNFTYSCCGMSSPSRMSSAERSADHGDAGLAARTQRRRGGGRAATAGGPVGGVVGGVVGGRVGAVMLVAHQGAPFVTVGARARPGRPCPGGARWCAVVRGGAGAGQRPKAMHPVPRRRGYRWRRLTVVR